MTAPFHADHVVGAAVANLCACGASLKAMLHVRVGCLIVVMHNAPCAVIPRGKENSQQHAKGRPRRPRLSKSPHREIAGIMWAYSPGKHEGARKLSWKRQAVHRRYSFVFDRYFLNTMRDAVRSPMLSQSCGQEMRRRRGAAWAMVRCGSGNGNWTTLSPTASPRND